MTYPVKSEDVLGEDIIFHDGFPTPNKLGKIMPVDIIYPNDEISSDFPMILSTGRLLEHWHTGTMTRRALVLDELEPVPVIFINEMLEHSRNANTSFLSWQIQSQQTL